MMIGAKQVKGLVEIVMTYDLREGRRAGCTKSGMDRRMAMMVNKIINVLLVCLPLTGLYPKNLTEKVAANFINALITNAADLPLLVDNSEQKMVTRLGINYTDARYKAFIANGIDPEIKKNLLSRRLKFTY
jgi:hypothetical protein